MAKDSRFNYDLEQKIQNGGGGRKIQKQRLLNEFGFWLEGDSVRKKKNYKNKNKKPVCATFIACLVKCNKLIILFLKCGY